MKRVMEFLGRRKVWAVPYVAVMAVMVVLPLLLLGWYSFVDEDGFTLK